MIGDRVCSSGLSALCSGAVPACPVRPVVGVEGRRDTRTAARGRCAATEQSEPSPVLAGSRGPGRACPDASEGATRPPDCHAGNVVALAPQADRRAVAAAEATGPVGFKYSATGADLRLGGRPSRWLCGRFVLADQASEDLTASDPVEWDRERVHIWIVVGCSKVKRAVGPSAVVVDGVLLQHDAQMSLPRDEHPVGAFGPGGENPALREGIRSWLSGQSTPICPDLRRVTIGRLSVGTGPGS